VIDLAVDLGGAMNGHRVRRRTVHAAVAGVALLGTGACTQGFGGSRPAPLGGGSGGPDPAEALTGLSRGLAFLESKLQLCPKFKTLLARLGVRKSRSEKTASSDSDPCQGKPNERKKNMNSVVVQAIGLALVGILAGIEFIVRYGVQPALRNLDDHAHVAARVALVRRLRFVVPSVMLPAVAASVAALVVSGGNGAGFRWAGMAALVAFLLFSFLGTVPINNKVIDWQPDNPPADWLSTVLRWQRIDVARSTAAIVAFICFVIAFSVQVP
jgi:hypothetical protein